MRPHDELLLLGLLDAQQMHGYALAEFLEHRLQFVSDLTKPTAYRLLGRLHARGLVEREVERAGRRPERLVYRITTAGRARLDALLREQLATAEQTVYAANVALLLSDRLPPSERVALLERRRAGVAMQRDRLGEAVALHPLGSAARLTLGHDLAHIDAELAWLDQTIAELR